MFQNFLISIVILPLLLAVSAANGRDGARHRRVLKIGWTSYTVVWFCTLYYLRYRWS
jgi:hypothetical protein